jgi:hypothetical protein
MKGLIGQGEAVTLDFGGIKHPHFTEYYNLFLHVTFLMQEMLSELERLGIPIEYKALSSFHELSESTLFNCTGLGSIELKGDQALVPMTGYLLMINDGTFHPYLIYHRTKQEGHDEDLYFFPKTSYVSSKQPLGIPTTGVMGGTYLPFSNEDMYRKEMKKMLDRHMLFFYGRPFGYH